MKKQRIQFALLMAIVMVAMSPQKVWALGGSGTSSSPYTIANASDLVAFANKVNGTEQGAYAKLTADITLTSAWTAMGTSSKPYTGTFDGQGHTISGLNLTATAANAGLFGYVNNATIKDFTLAGSVKSNSDNVGSVVGSADGATKIYNVYSSANITMSAAKSHIGGIVGQLLQENNKVSEVKGCAYSGTINLGSCSDSNGGIVGYCEKNANVEIEYCFFSGSISTSASNSRVGGILGYADDDGSTQNFEYLRYCFVSGTFTTGSGTGDVGAIAGCPRGKVVAKITDNTYVGTLLVDGKSRTAVLTNGNATNPLGNGKTDNTTKAANKAITIDVKCTGYGGSVDMNYVNPTSTTPTQLYLEPFPKIWGRVGSWSDKGTGDMRTVSLSEDVILYAKIVEHFLVLTLSADPNQGTVSGGGEYHTATQVTISATPKEGYRFVCWSDECTLNPWTFILGSDKELTAIFALKYNCNAKPNNSDWGRVDVVQTPNGIYHVTAESSNSSYRFVRWSDGYDKPYREYDENELTEDVNVTAIFELIPSYNITVKANNSGYGVVSGGGSCLENLNITITAEPKEGFVFVRWDDNNTQASRTVNVTGNKTYTAIFVPKAKAVYNNGKLTFYYDEKEHKEGIVYPLNTTSEPEWLEQKKSIEEVYFDESFGEARPTTCAYWFAGCYNLKNIHFDASLRTQDVTNMSHMFAGCSKIALLSLVHFDISEVTDMTSMFEGCSELVLLQILDFNMMRVKSCDNMFNECPKLTALTLASIPYLKNGTFNVKFADASHVEYDLHDAYTTVTQNYSTKLPDATYAHFRHRLYNELETVAMPFNVIYNAEDSNYKLYRLIAAKGDDLIFKEYDDKAVIPASTPMLIKATGEKDNYGGWYEVELEGYGAIVIDKIENESVDGLTMKGTYATLEDQTGVYVIDQDKFKYAEASAYVPAFSAWLTGNVPSGAKTLNIVLKDADTDIPISFTVDDVNILANLLITGSCTEEQLILYDVDKDGKLTIADLVKIISQLNNSTNK